VEPGRYQAEMSGAASAYDYEVDGRAFTFAAPPTFTAMATLTATDPATAEVVWSPALPDNPLGTGERMSIQVLDADGPTSYACGVGQAFLVDEGDRGELPSCAFPAPGTYELVLQRTASEHPDRDFDHDLYYSGASTTVERRLSLTIP
jgi:hypothetical protein